MISISLLASLSGVAQKVQYLRASVFNVGVNKTDSIQWLGEKDCNILIELYPSLMIINSAEEQRYHRVTNVKDDGHTKTWEVTDKDGDHLYLSMVEMEGYDTIIVYVDYDDVVWYYLSELE